MRSVLAALLCAACGRGGEPQRAPTAGSSADLTAPAAPAPAPDAGPCTPLPFAASTPVPEASGAAWLEVDGRPALLVISDSGNDGAYAIVAADSGDTLEQGKLPLGGNGNDDLEGIAVHNGRFHAISSPGWVRVYERAGRGFRLVDGPYPLGPVGGRMVCEVTNCGRNYEGLCLASDPAARCVGFAASKADGHLYCLVVKDGRLVVEQAGSIAVVAHGKALADCAFSDDGRLYAGSNLFDLGNVYRIDGWRDPATATVSLVAALGTGFPETLAVRGDVFYRMSDIGAAPSAMTTYRCR